MLKEQGFSELEMADGIVKQCDMLKHFLLTKNSAYGNSTSQPIRIFSQLSPIEGILVRIDDKLSRLKFGSTDAKDQISEDTVTDLIGYLILLQVQTNLLKFQPVNLDQL